MDALSFEVVSSKHHVFYRFLPKLKSIYSEMDMKYQTVAAKYGFVCRGCEENCCRTRFYHHTLLEYFYIREGYHGLPSDTKQRVGNRAKTVRAISTLADRKEIPVREMCPLNFNGRCILYAYRPMICRLHGVPHELHRPGKSGQRHPACDAFYDQCKDAPYRRFDRTPFYLKMAELERELKAESHITQKIKMTVSEILNEF